MGRRTSNPWTPREDARICALRRRGETASNIAAELPERTLIAVVRRIEHLIRLGRIEQQKTPWTDAEDEKLCALRKRGLSNAEIASQFDGRTVHALAGRIRHLIAEGKIAAHGGDHRQRPRWTPREEAQLAALRERDATADEIADKIGRSRAAVEARIHALLADGEIERKPYAPRTHRPWSIEEDELVAVMRKARTSVPKIAEALDRTVASVNSRIAQRVRKGELELLP